MSSWLFACSPFLVDCGRLTATVPLNYLNYFGYLASSLVTPGAYVHRETYLTNTGRTGMADLPEFRYFSFIRMRRFLEYRLNRWPLNAIKRRTLLKGDLECPKYASGDVWLLSSRPRPNSIFRFGHLHPWSVSQIRLDLRNLEVCILVF